MTQTAPAALANRHIFRVYLKRVYLKTPPPFLVGATPGANRRIFEVTGGTFEGERLRGTLASGGSDWMTVRSDGSVAFNHDAVRDGRGAIRLAQQHRRGRVGRPRSGGTLLRRLRGAVSTNRDLANYLKSERSACVR
jgi:hypothetical protein